LGVRFGLEPQKDEMKVKMPEIGKKLVLVEYLI
jgi:hypothetical protein